MKPQKGKSRKFRDESKDNSEENHELQNQDPADPDPDEEDEGPTCLPGQEHCEWLLNVIRIQAKKVAQELLLEERHVSNTTINKLRNETADLRKQVRPQSVESLNGGFFTRVFSAVGRSG